MDKFVPEQFSSRYWTLTKEEKIFLQGNISEGSLGHTNHLVKLVNASFNDNRFSLSKTSRLFQRALQVLRDNPEISENKILRKNILSGIKDLSTTINSNPEWSKTASKCKNFFLGKGFQTSSDILRNVGQEIEGMLSYEIEKSEAGAGDSSIERLADIVPGAKKEIIAVMNLIKGIPGPEKYPALRTLENALSTLMKFSKDGEQEAVCKAFMEHLKVKFLPDRATIKQEFSNFLSGETCDGKPWNTYLPPDKKDLISELNSSKGRRLSPEHAIEKIKGELEDSKIQGIIDLKNKIEIAPLSSFEKLSALEYLSRMKESRECFSLFGNFNNFMQEVNAACSEPVKKEDLRNAFRKCVLSSTALSGISRRAKFRYLNMVELDNSKLDKKFIFQEMHNKHYNDRNYIDAYENIKNKLLDPRISERQRVETLRCLVEFSKDLDTHFPGLREEFLSFFDEQCKKMLLPRDCSLLTSKNLKKMFSEFETSTKLFFDQKEVKERLESICQDVAKKLPSDKEWNRLSAGNLIGDIQKEDFPLIETMNYVLQDNKCCPYLQALSGEIEKQITDPKERDAAYRAIMKAVHEACTTDGILNVKKVNINLIHQAVQNVSFSNSQKIIKQVYNDFKITNKNLLKSIESFVKSLSMDEKNIFDSLSSKEQVDVYRFINTCKKLKIPNKIIEKIWGEIRSLQGKNEIVSRSRLLSVIQKKIEDPRDWGSDFADIKNRESAYRSLNSLEEKALAADASERITRQGYGLLKINPKWTASQQKDVLCFFESLMKELESLDLENPKKDYSFIMNSLEEDCPDILEMLESLSKITLESPKKDSGVIINIKPVFSKLQNENDDWVITQYETTTPEEKSILNAQMPTKTKAAVLRKLTKAKKEVEEYIKITKYPYKDGDFFLSLSRHFVKNGKFAPEIITPDRLDEAIKNVQNLRDEVFLRSLPSIPEAPDINSAIRSATGISDTQKVLFLCTLRDQIKKNPRSLGEKLDKLQKAVFNAKNTVIPGKVTVQSIEEAFK